MIQVRTTLLLLFLAAISPAWAANVLIVTPFTADDTSPDGLNANAHVSRLQGIFSQFDLSVQRALVVPDAAGLASNDQVWDIWAAPTGGNPPANPNGKAITPDEIQRYVAYLASGKRVVVFGDHSGFFVRNNSILSLIQAAGGGTLTYAPPPAVSGTNQSPEDVLPPFTGPNALSDGKVTFIAAGGVSNAGSGQFMAIDRPSGIGTAVVFPPGTLANAPTGTLIVIFDQNIMDGDFRPDYLDYGRFLTNIVSYAPAQVPIVSTVATGLGRPFGVAIYNGTAYVPDPSTHRIFGINLTTKQVSVVAGTGEQGFNGDGIDALQAQLDNPSGVAANKDGLYIADTGNHVVRKIATPGVPGAIMTTVAGIPTQFAVGESTPAACLTTPTASQCTPANSLRLYGPRALTLDSAGNLYIVDRMNQQVKKLYTSGTLSGLMFVVAGVAGYTGSNNGPVDGPAFCSSELCTLGARLNSPVGVAVDAFNNVYVATEGSNNIRVVSPGEGGATVSTQLATGLLRPTGVALDGDGNIYIANYGMHAIVELDCGGDCPNITIAGTSGVPSAEGAGTDATHLRGPTAIAIDGTTLYIADTLNGRLGAVTLPSAIFLK